MATLTINIPTDREQWVLDGFKTRFGYKEFVTNPDFNASEPVDPVINPMTIPNPETPVAFAKRMVIIMIKQAALEGHNTLTNEANAVEASIVNLT